MADEQVRDLGWWSIAGEVILEMLERAHDGEHPDVLYAELYANSDRDYVPPKEDD